MLYTVQIIPDYFYNMWPKLEIRFFAMNYSVSCVESEIISF